MFKSFRLLLAGSVLAGSVLAACSAPAPSSVDVSLTTYKITLSSEVAKAGQVTFHVKNDAKDLVHEFVVFKTDLSADKMPMNDQGLVDEESSEVTAIDEVEDLQQGQSQDLVVTLDPGHYVLLCNTAGHYVGGMHIDLTVTP